MAEIEIEAKPEALLGSPAVPSLRIEPGPAKRLRKRGRKACTCADCGAPFEVRADTFPVVCRRCASARGGRAMAGHQRALRKPCAQCGAAIRASLGDSYCSLACRAEAVRVQRECKQCGVAFKVYRSAISGSTNAAGNFCSRPCYDRWQCNTGRTTGRGSRWRQCRDEAIARAPFCALCGTAQAPQVHHVAPFRLSYDNGQPNLVPLCARHHKTVECITHEIEATGLPPALMTLALGSMLREWQAATTMKLRELRHVARAA